MAAANVEPGLLKTGVDKPNSLPTVTAYRHTKTLARQQKAAATSVHWQVRPGAAAEIHAFDGWQHQALACRATPHPLDGAMCRWPDSGHKVGGPNGPQDGRQHHLDFGYREGREKKAWMPNAEVPQGAAVSLSLTDIKAALTKRFGSLLVAYNRMDFFKDGFLSPIEWQEGIHIIFHSFKGEDSVRYRSLCEPRPVFNRRMKELFKFTDVNGDALISFEEFSGCVRQPVERPRELIERKNHEKMAAATFMSTLSSTRIPQGSCMSPSFASTSRPPPAATSSPSPIASSPSAASVLKASTSTSRAAGSEDLRAFATLLMQKYRNVDEAFRAIDVNGSGELSMAEFVEGAKLRVRFSGDVKAIFQSLDMDRSGAIGVQEFRKLRGLKANQEEVEKHQLKTTKDIVAKRRLRSPIPNPQPHERGVTLSSSGHQPLGEKTSTSAGFYTFHRSPTGRLDRLLHPEELPGFDPQNFSDGCGPGYLERGPDHFSNVGDSSHPIRGASWRGGAAQSRSERFAPVIPSFQNHAGHRPSGAVFCGPSGHGATSVAARGGRMGKTMGSADSAGMMVPKPIGPWGHSRVTLRCKSLSEPSLLKQAC